MHKSFLRADERGSNTTQEDETNAPTKNTQQAHRCRRHETNATTKNTQQTAAAVTRITHGRANVDFFIETTHTDKKENASVRERERDTQRERERQTGR